MPLPSFSWANGEEVWNNMLEKDVAYAKLKSPNMLDHHPSLVPSYRTILLDWMSEVSHECKFHRETYHLAVDFVDRFLNLQSDIDKLKLQLLGTTCLFLAAKFEEIHPPTVSDFADLTDGACKVEDIINIEVVILEALNWEISPITPNNWLNTYMQILLNLDKENSQIDDSFIIPSNNGISRSNHKRIACVLDLAILHINSLTFSPSMLTAAALSHFTDELTLRQCTGYKFRQLAKCAKWLKPFVDTVKEIREPVFISSAKGENSTQLHSHISNSKMLDTVISKMAALPQPQQVSAIKRRIPESFLEELNSITTLTPIKPSALLTPPRSGKKRCSTNLY